MLSLNTNEGEEFLKELVKLQSKWADILYKGQASNLQISEIPFKENQYLGSGNICSQSNLHHILQNIVQLLQLYQPKLKKELVSLELNFEEIYEIIINGNELDLLQWASQHQITPLLLGQLVDWSLRPEKMALGRVIQPLIDDKVNWENPYCPVCREPADIGTLSKENGERQLGCSCCQITWRYPRLKCISCENTNPHELKYYFVDEAPEQQIHYCQVCNSYLKTIDYRLTTEKLEDLMLLNYTTAHLDILAQQKGLGINNIN